MTDIEKAREAFLAMLADALVFEEQPDGDMNSNGRIKRARYDQSLMDAINDAIQLPASID